jgi:signal transduction histidine kinase
VRFRVGTRIVLACLALVCAPVVTAWLMGLYDRYAIADTESDLEAIEAGADVEALARAHAVYLRRFDASGGQLAASSPHWGDGRVSRIPVWAWFADLFFGPEGPPDLLAFDAELGPVHARPEVRQMFQTGQPSIAWHGPKDGSAFVLFRVIPTDDGYLYAARISRRSVRALYDARFQLLKLTLALAVGALVMGAWLTFSVVGPLMKLQRRVRGNLAAGTAEPIALTRRDEIGQLSRDFDRLTKRLVGQVEQSAHVAADFAHDLKNPIAAVQAASELLDGETLLDDERRQRIAKSVRLAGEHMRRSVDAMLALARLDEGLEKEPRAEVDLAGIVRAAAERFDADVHRDGVTLTVEAPVELVIFGNAERLRDLVDNLVDNAAEFARSNVQVRLTASNGGAEVVVADDGPGVPEGNRDKVFLRFFAARPPERPRGSGLGLAIVDAVARAHGGAVTLLDDHPLGGAAFRVHLDAGMKS